MSGPGANLLRTALTCALLAAPAWAPAQRLAIVLGGDAAEVARLQDAFGAALASWEQGYDGPLGVLFGADGGTPPADVGALASARIGDPALLGPDVATLTLLVPGEPTEVRVSPTWLDTPHPLLHEIGVLLGLEPSTSGVMAVAIAQDPAERPTEPQASDLTALRNAFRFPPEDLTRDGVVDFYDLLELAASFGVRGFLPADLNDDGVVDRADLERLQAAYTFTAPSPDPPASAGGAEPNDAAPSGDGSGNPEEPGAAGDLDPIPQPAGDGAEGGEPAPDTPAPDAPAPDAPAPDAPAPDAPAPDAPAPDAPEDGSGTP